MSDALSEGKFGNSLYLRDFPAKVRVLTVDPVVHMDKYGGTRYAFVVWSFDEDRPFILDRGPSFSTRFKQIHVDPDFGGNIQRIDLKISTNGKSGQDVRYSIDPLGSPYDLSPDKIRKAAAINLDEKIENGIRLSRVNKGERVPGSKEPEDEVGIDDQLPDSGPLNLDDIPF